MAKKYIWSYGFYDGYWEGNLRHNVANKHATQISMRRTFPSYIIDFI